MLLSWISSLNAIRNGRGGIRVLPGRVANLSDQALIKLAEADLRARREVCAAQGDAEMCAIIDRADGLDQWLAERIGDVVRRGMDFQSAINPALLEALYGLTSDAELQNYLAEPLFNTAFTFQTYYDFWRTGAKYALSPAELLICRPQIHA